MQEGGGLKHTPKQLDLPGVPRERAKQGREVDTRWAWTEAAVWTTSMLATLERGIQGGKWFSLIDKVYREGNLLAAMEKVVSNGGAAGIDRQSVGEFEREAESNLRKLQEELREGRYEPKAVRRVWIEKLGSKEKRPLGIPAVRDRVVQTALRNVIEPIFERDFAGQSYGFRPGRGAMDALSRVEQLLEQGLNWVVDADLKGYFDSIPQERLMERVSEKIADGRVLGLLGRMLKAGVMESAKEWQPTETGTPQGSVISPLLANVYLNALDHQMAESGHQMVRYADDFVVLCASAQEAQAVLEKIGQWTQAEGLVLHPEKTRIVDANARGGFDFLGYHFERGMKWPREKSAKRFREAVRARTPRSSGASLGKIIAGLNALLRGWHGYFCRSQPTVFVKADGYVRGRLRRILQQRHKRKGNGRGYTHYRWPNAYFTEHGLIALVSLNRAKVSQPP